MRRRARLKEAQNWGELPTSVAGGSRKAGSAPARPTSCGPGIVRARGSVTLAAPSGGRSGLPNEAACASVAVIAAAPAAVAASAPRRDRLIDVSPEGKLRFGVFTGRPRLERVNDAHF